MNKNAHNSPIKRLILHFNIDKTIIMRDCLSYNNTDFLVKFYNSAQRDPLRTPMGQT
jgi:hypothetical protein